jgi:ribose/xylose/arabinose/galactoside ABC-type transport system permease subunit/ABC-type branched-subunit amino acid transport system ATPase component
VAIHFGTIAAVVAGPVLGLLLGAFNGGLVRLLKLSPLIVTIGTLAGYQGLAFVVSNGVPVYGFPVAFLTIGRGGIGAFTFPIMIALLVVLLGGFWLGRTRSGLHVYAIGGDERATALNGINVGSAVVGLYSLNGALVGVAATLLAARLGSVSPQFGTQFVFDVLTAVILGGVAFSGGSGRPVGIFIGVVTIGILSAGLLFEGLEDYWQQIAKGAVLLLALGSDQVLQRVRAAGGWRTWHRRTFRGEAAPLRKASDRAGAFAMPRSLRRTTSLAEARIVLDARDLTVGFGPVTALAGADISVRAGEIVCLLGDNGAGKSTFIKVLSGAQKPDRGAVVVDGKNVELGNPRIMRDAGIETVYQDLALVPPLSVAHNFVLGDEPMRRLFGIVPVRDEAEADRRARTRLAALGIQLNDYRVPVARLSGGQRQAVAIARAVHDDVKLLILDEPTEALGVTQTQAVLELVRSVADRGTGVVLITHDVETVSAIADRVVVLRLGTITFDGRAADLSTEQLLHLMSGRSGDRSRVTAAEQVRADRRRPRAAAPRR